VTDEPPLRRRAAESRTGNAPHDPPSARPEPADAGDDPTAGGPVPLTAPREGTPEPVATQRELDEVVARFAAGTGPVALAAARASGYRYRQRA
jgi:ribonuclease D